MGKKVVYILSQVDKAVAFEWLVEEFQNKSIELVFILINDRSDTPFSNFLEKQKVEFYTFPLKYKRHYLLTAFKISRVLKSLGNVIVHAHLFEGGLIGLTAAKLAGVKKRIYTRHHSTSHHEYFPNAVKYDKLINWLATDIIAISNNVKEVLIEKENLKHNKITLVEHGFKLNQFRNVEQESVDQLYSSHRIPKGKTIIATISRYVELKGIEYVIEAFKEVNKTYPETHLLLANSGGNYESVIRKKLAELNPDTYSEIKFEPDLFALYKVIDIFCHVPINSQVEAYGQTYVEALAAGVPSIFTLSGIAKDFIEDEKNALVVDYKNSEQIIVALKRILEDNVLRNTLIVHGFESIERFDINQMINSLKQLYFSEN
jgi:glycosyltransferase involved in cell wall biosynthesis